MKKLRRVFVSLIIALAAIFTIQWLNSIQESTLGLESFVYLLVLVAVASQLAMPITRRRHGILLLLGWLALFFILKLTIFNARPLFGGIHTYITISSIGILAFMSWLAFYCAKALAEFEDTIRQMILGRHGNQIHDSQSAQALVQAEMLRSRNFSRPLSIISLHTPKTLNEHQVNKLILEIERSIAHKLAFEQLADFIGQQTRRTDVLILDKGLGQLIVMCPETDPSTAREVAGQLSQVVNESLDIKLTWGAASFPDEGLTYQALLEQAVEIATARSQEESRDQPLPVTGKAIIQGK